MAELFGNRTATIESGNLEWWPFDVTTHGTGLSTTVALVAGAIIYLIHRLAAKLAEKVTQTPATTMTHASVNTETKEVRPAKCQTEGGLVPEAAYKELQTVVRRLEWKVDAGKSREQQLLCELAAHERHLQRAQEGVEEIAITDDINAEFISEEEQVLWREEYDELNILYVESEKRRKELEQEVQELKAALAQQQTPDALQKENQIGKEQVASS